MRVYRIAKHRSPRQGPYASDDFYKTWSDNRLANRHYDPYMCPPPSLDGIDYSESRHHFGFQSIAQMRRWFTPKARTALASAGYVLREYEVAPEHVSIGRKQVAFVLDEAKLIRKYPLGEL